MLKKKKNMEGVDVINLMIISEGITVGGGLMSEEDRLFLRSYR